MRKNFSTLTLILILVISVNTARAETDFFTPRAADKKIMPYMVLGSAAVCGVVNGIREKSFSGFLDGFWKGAVGGIGLYAGERIGREKNCAYPGLFLRSGGQSIISNTILGRGMFSRYKMKIWMFSLQFSDKDFRYGIDVHTIEEILTVTKNKNKFLLGKSLETGTLVFLAQDIPLKHLATYRKGIIRLNKSHFPESLKAKPYSSAGVLSHERIHRYQFDLCSITEDLIEDELLFKKLPGWIPRLYFSGDYLYRGAIKLTQDETEVRSRKNLWEYWAYAHQKGIGDN